MLPPAAVTPSKEGTPLIHASVWSSWAGVVLRGSDIARGRIGSEDAARGGSVSLTAESVVGVATGAVLVILGDASPSASSVVPRPESSLVAEVIGSSTLGSLLGGQLTWKAEIDLGVSSLLRARGTDSPDLLRAPLSPAASSSTGGDAAERCDLQGNRRHMSLR